LKYTITFGGNSISKMKFIDFLRKSNLTEHQYQVDGVEWCLKNEKEGNTICEKNTIRGGFMCDDMGLGKTIQMLGVILENFQLKTLIVLPLALVRQWECVIKKMVGHQPLIFHGKNKKEITLEKLNQSAIVLTTYGELNEKIKTSALLRRVKWFRVIFDEAHHMRNEKTSVFKGALSLSASIRWLMTGTPIQNKINDFYNLSALLGVPSIYSQNKANLEKFVSMFMLRRTKESIGLEIPKIIEEVIETTWENASENSYSLSIHNETNNSCIDDALEIKCLLQRFIRQRQTCISASLMKDKITPFVKKIKSKISDCSICLEEIDLSICIEDNSAMRLKLCDHVFHKKCIEEWFSYEKTNCPYCRESATKYELTTVEINVMEEAMECENSSKIRAVVKTLNERKGNGNSKIVFCHYKGEIDMIKTALLDMEEGFNIKVIDGRCSQKERNKILENKENKEMIILIQIQTGCEGLNLQWCNEVYFVSPHWNPSVEDQAVARCHRMGQEKPVYVFRYVMMIKNETSKKGMNYTLDNFCVKKQEMKRNLMREINDISEM
jgi:SWI/SNF-related matrix-associated actin-dependent regulator of chromatin subfamily A3